LWSFTVHYEFSWDFDGTYESYLEMYGLADCTTVYTASGEVDERTGRSIRYLGPWEDESSDCNTSLVNAIWFSQSKDRYATFNFSADLSTLDDWIEHADVSNDEPVEEPSAHKQWYITEMYAPVESDDSGNLSATYDTEEEFVLDIIPTTIVHHVEFSFLQGPG
jgi:hypothetical protein